MRSPDELSAAFRAQGLKVTPQRQCIFGVLHGNASHPTADAVHAAAVAQMPAISLKTVYQTLNDLAGMGEIALLDLGTGAVRFDPNVEDAHHHLVCERCGKVRDLHADFGTIEVPDGLTQGFRVGSAEIVFRGRCEACAAFPRSSNHHQQGASWLN
jgi:Fur family transcriptional regulator, stress-responsive regulator